MHIQQKQWAKLQCFDGRSTVTSVEQAPDILLSVMGLGQDIMTKNSNSIQVFKNTKICLHQGNFIQHHHQEKWLWYCFFTQKALFFSTGHLTSKLWMMFTVQIHLKLIQRTLFGRKDQSSQWNSGFCLNISEHLPIQHTPYSPDFSPCDFLEFPLLKHEPQRQKLSTETEVKQSTAATLCKMSGNGILYMFEKWVGHYKKCIPCERCYIKRERVPKPQ
jgi:hypothetical protein